LLDVYYSFKLSADQKNWITSVTEVAEIIGNIRLLDASVSAPTNGACVLLCLIASAGRIDPLVDGPDFIVYARSVCESARKVVLLGLRPVGIGSPALLQLGKEAATKLGLPSLEYVEIQVNTSDNGKELKNNISPSLFRLRTIFNEMQK
jgi:hypothetical protein